MKTAHRRTKKAVRVILEATGLTQADFARTTGVSLDTVKSWSLGRAAISQQFETRIAMATGAVINRDGSVTSHWRAGRAWVDKPYSNAAFNFWRKNIVKSDTHAAKIYLREASRMLSLIFRACVEEQAANDFGRLAAVWASFHEWAAQVMKDFDLTGELNRVRSAKQKTRA